MKTWPLLILTLPPLLCQFATVTLGGPVVSKVDHIKSFKDLNFHFEGADACFKTAKEYFQTPKGEFSEATVVKSIDPEASKTRCSISIPDLERKVQKPEDPFYTLTEGRLLEDIVVKFRDSETSRTYSFISIPDLEGKDHVYVVQLATMLGSGEFGNVYLAKDIENPNEFVAIKKSLHAFPGIFQNDLDGLKAIGELLGMDAGSLVLVMPFVPGIQLSVLAKTKYNGRFAYEYWKDNNQEGLHTLLYRIAREVVSPLMNMYIIHKDLAFKNMMVAQTDGNYVPTETDPSTGLQHFRAIDFGYHENVKEGCNIVEKIFEVTKAMLHVLRRLAFREGEPLTVDDDEWLKVIEREWMDLLDTFQIDVVGALDKNKYDIVINETGMPTSVIRKKEKDAAVVPDVPYDRVVA